MSSTIKRRESFGREKRVRKRSEYLAVQDGGEKFRSHHFLLALASVDKITTPENPSGKPVDKPCIICAPFRFGVTVSKKVDKRAARRNKLRRRVKEYLRRRLWKIEARGAMVIIALKGAAELDYETVGKELNFLLKKSGLVVVRGARSPQIIGGK